MKIFNKILQIYSDKVLFDPYNLFAGHSWPFLLEDSFIIVDSLKQADIFVFRIDYESFFDNNQNTIGRLLPSLVSTIPGYNISKIGINFHIFHIDNHMHTNFYLREHENFKQGIQNTITVHKDILSKNDNVPPYLIYYDSMFNRQKLYFTEYFKVNNWREKYKDGGKWQDFNFIWTMYTEEKTFALSKIEKDFSEDSKLFLFLGRIYHFSATMMPVRMKYRVLLKEFMKMNYSEISFISETGKWFLTNEANDSIKRVFDDNKGGWYPVADEYYNKSMVSVYIETVTDFECKKEKFPIANCVTEKTFDPLIKGNFILPFGYPGLIKDILNYGFLLPDFIDYSYDNETDFLQRFERYLASIEKVANITNIRECYERNKHILEHNRNVFYTRPYDTLHDKIAKFKESPYYISTLGNSIL